MYPDGLVRFASGKFLLLTTFVQQMNWIAFVLAKYSDNSEDLNDRYMHLTNYSINKLSSQYTANEDANACQGHKW